MFPQLVPERERKKGNYLFEMYTHTQMDTKESLLICCDRLIPIFLE